MANETFIYRPRGTIALGVATETLTGARTLTAADPAFLYLNPDGDKDVTLDDAAASHGMRREIVNTAGGAGTITVKNPAGSTLETIEQNRAAVFHNVAGTWTFGHKYTIALT